MRGLSIRQVRPPGKCAPLAAGLVLVLCSAGLAIEGCDGSSRDAGASPAAVETSAARTERLDVDVTSNAGPSDPLVGLMHDSCDPHRPDGACVDRDQVAALHPRFWRVSDPRNYQCARALHPKITYVLMDGYADYHPRPEPWKDWAGWEGYVAKTVRLARSHDAPVDYWEPWGEPWANPTNAEQVLEAFRRANAVIRREDPAAKVVGPSLAHWHEAALTRFLDDSVQHGLRYDAISWHEFDRPEDVPAHVQRARELIAARPALGTPEIHINEYANEEQHLVPGTAVGWIAALERANVQWTSLACWDCYENGAVWSDCWHGLEGLFLRDGRTPQALYWVFRRYSEMRGRRLTTAGDTPRTAGLATWDDARRELRVLLGRSQRIETPAAAADVLVTLSRVPASILQVTVTIDRIPFVPVAGHPNAVQPLASPVSGPPAGLPVDQGTLRIRLPAVQEGEAVSILVRPAPPRGGE